ncbi:histidine phosphatase family protein [Ectobacillus funiculus]|uniref:Histidine phosphatase family protein n=1 Tax=Ectobacillus funiculus TaxID=137993 RepID=A0ABV5WK81_9BACI
MGILLIRHGQSDADLEAKRYEGKADFPLTETGRLQVKAMSEYIYKHFSIQHIFSSPLKRAKETAEILSCTTGTKVTFFEELSEMDNGVLKGMTKKWADKLYPKPKVPRKIHESILGGESEIDFRYRVEKIFSYILDESEKAGLHCIAVVGHGGTLSMILQVILRLPVGYAHFFTNDTGIHHIYCGKYPVVDFLNKTEHLQEHRKGDNDEKKGSGT